jgi:hypothetical protein
VQEEFFLPRDLNEDSILNQGVEGAAGDPQVIGGSTLLVDIKAQQQDPGEI